MTDKPFECKHCDRRFAMYGDLHRHHKAKHPDLPAPKPPPRPPGADVESEADRHINRILFGRWS